MGYLKMQGGEWLVTGRCFSQPPAMAELEGEDGELPF